MTGRDTVRFVASLAPTRRRGDAGGSTPSSVGSASPMRPTAGRAPTPVACASGWASPRRSSDPAGVLLLDEPVSALDPIGRREVLDLMRELKGETTVFYSTHILEDVERVSDHVAILDGGRLVRPPRPTSCWPASRRTDCGSVLDGADGAATVDLAALPGVIDVEPIERAATSAPTTCACSPVPPSPVQRAVTRYAAEHDLIVDREQPRPPGAGGRVPSPHRPEGACGMTASTTHPPRPARRHSAGRRPVHRRSGPRPQGPRRLGAQPPPVGHPRRSPGCS